MNKREFACKIADVITEKLWESVDSLEEYIISYIDNNGTTEVRKIDLDHIVKSSYNDWGDNCWWHIKPIIDAVINRFLNDTTT